VKRVCKVIKFPRSTYYDVLIRVPSKKDIDKIKFRENVLDRDFNATVVNQKWCTDITHIYVLKEGWTYLASVMDLYSRRIVG